MGDPVFTQTCELGHQTEPKTGKQVFPNDSQTDETSAEVALKEGEKLFYHIFNYEH